MNHQNRNHKNLQNINNNSITSIKLQLYQQPNKTIFTQNQISNCSSEDDLDPIVFKNLVPPQLPNNKKKSIVKLKRIVTSLSNKPNTFQRFNKSELSSLKSYLEHSSSSDKQHHQNQDNESSSDKVERKNQQKCQVQQKSENLTERKDLSYNYSTLIKKTKKEKKKKSKKTSNTQKQPIIMTNQVFDIIKDYFS